MLPLNFATKQFFFCEADDIILEKEKNWSLPIYLTVFLTGCQIFPFQKCEMIISGRMVFLTKNPLRKVHPIVLAILLLAGAVAATMGANAAEKNTAGENLESTVPVLASEQKTEIEEMPEQKEQKGEEEMRAVWVPYMNLTMSNGDGSAATFYETFDKIVEGAKEKGMNTLIVHVRPFGDSLYPSEYFPWSSILTGTQGIHPGYDPLEYMVEAAHQAGMEIHAWVNPLRIQSKNTPEVLAQSNPYNQWKQDPEKAGWTVDLSTGKYYNPAYPEVRQLIADGVKEIVTLYNVDGVQFDDYFYPTESKTFDSAAYQEYLADLPEGEAAMELGDWRRENINELVAQCYEAVKEANPKAVFGISPQGNITNDWNMGADVARWCSTSGYIDYICPQLYVNFEHPTLPYDGAAEEWRELVTSEEVDLYLGLAVYKAGSDSDEGTWKNSSDILARQIELGRELGCDGFMFYSWDYLMGEQAEEEVANAMKVLSGES